MLEMLFIVRFAYLDRENCTYDGGRTREWSPPYERMVGSIRMYARHRSIVNGCEN